MPSNSSTIGPAVKACCQCGTDLSGQPRMKDSQQRYWCVPCGEADQRKKQMTATHLPCVGCRKQFPKAKLNKHGEHFFCKPCLKKRTAAEASAHKAEEKLHSGIGSAHSSGAAAANAPNSDKRRALVLALLLVALILFSLLYNFVLLA